MISQNLKSASLCNNEYTTSTEDIKCVGGGVGVCAAVCLGVCVGVCTSAIILLTHCFGHQSLANLLRNKLKCLLLCSAYIFHLAFCLGYFNIFMLLKTF